MSTGELEIAFYYGELQIYREQQNEPPRVGFKQLPVHRQSYPSAHTLPHPHKQTRLFWSKV